MITTATPATTVQLFVSTVDPTTGRTYFDTEIHGTAASALADLMGSAKDLGWDVTPTIEDGEIVYRLTGDDITEGLATIS